MSSIIKLVIIITITCSTIHSITAKVYRRCELAKELRDIYGMPENQLATWICIIGHESSYNTSAISEGAESYGLFQINREYWCSTNGGRGCGISCSALRDDDIRDDVDCAKRIFQQHQRITGDGFKAWTLYNYRCKTNVERYIRDCYEGGDYHRFSSYKPVQQLNPVRYSTNYKFRPQVPVQAYSKSYYKTDEDYVDKSEEKAYSYRWTWSSNGGFRLHQSGHLPKKITDELFLIRRNLEKVTSWTSG